MIKAELSYNPYLLETLIKFNGQEPRINSLVEKFQGGSLQKWVGRIPEIFYDEMNGYDFELEFSGTKRDYQELVDAFRKQGVSEDLVRIFHKNELEGRKEKSALIDQLISWLNQNRNRNFDYGLFRSENTDLVDGSYVYIIFQGSQLSTESVNDPDVSVEHINSFEELKDTDLRNTPILIYISKDNLNSFQGDIKRFMSRNDVELDQIFFLIHPELDANKVERIIIDLGMKEPNIVSNIFDDAVKKYLEIYPVSEYIYAVIALFAAITDKLSQQLQADSEKYAIANREIHARIEQYESNIKGLKEAYQNFVNRDYLEIPDEWNNIKSELLTSIGNWKKYKTKTNDSYEADIATIEFENDVRRFYAQFLEQILQAANQTKQDIDTVYDSWYRSARFDSKFQVMETAFMCPEYTNEISFSDDLKKMFDEEYVMPKEDIFGKFFKSSNDVPKEPVLQRTYFYQNWRNYVSVLVKPREEAIISELFLRIKKYEQETAEYYIEHLSQLIDEQTSLKDQEAAQLSDDERLLQNDIDWLVKVQDQLNMIERGTVA